MNKDIMDFFLKLNKKIGHSDENSSERFIKYLELYGVNYSYMPINWQIEGFDIAGYKVVSTESDFYVDLLLVEFDETWATTKNLHIDFFEDELFSLCNYGPKECRKIYGHTMKYNLARTISKTKNSIRITLITNQHTDIDFDYVKIINIYELYNMYVENQHDKFERVLPTTSDVQEKIGQKYNDVDEYYYALTNSINSKKGDEHSNFIRFIEKYDLNYEFESLNVFFKGYSIKGYNKQESNSKTGYCIELIIVEFIQERMPSETFHIEEFQKEVWKLYDLNANECATKYGALSDEYKLSRLLHEVDGSICIKLITNQVTEIDLAHVKKVDINDLYNLYLKLYKNDDNEASMEFEVPHKVDITYAQKGVSRYYIELLDEIYDKNTNKYNNLINYLKSYGNKYDYTPLKLFRSGFCIKGYRVKKNTNKTGYCTELLIVEVSKEQVITRNQHIEALQEKIWELYGLKLEEYAEKYGINSDEYKLACALCKSKGSIRISFVTNQIASVSTLGVKTLDICDIQKLINNIDISSEVSIPKCEVTIPNEHVKIYIYLG